MAKLVNRILLPRAQSIHERPFTAAALGGVLGIALINRLRGK